MATDDVGTDDTYSLVHQAVEDALWNVIGTVVYSLFLVILFFFGLQGFLIGLSADSMAGSIFGVILGIALAGGCAFRFLLLFNIIPRFW